MVSAGCWRQERVRVSGSQPSDKTTRSSLPVWLSALPLAPTSLSELINARTTQCKHQWKCGFLDRSGGVGSQNYPMFYVEMTKIEFPLMFLLLNVAGGNVCRFLDHVTRWNTRPCPTVCVSLPNWKSRAPKQSLPAAGAHSERTKWQTGSILAAC